MPEDNSSNDSNMKWMVSTAVSLCAAGGGLVALLSYFNPKPSPEPTPPPAPVVNINTQAPSIQGQAGSQGTAQPAAKPAPPDPFAQTVLPSPSDAGPSMQANLTGRWMSVDGVAYNMVQRGDQIVFQEIHPMYGITAVGEGEVDANELSISYRLSDGSTGSGDLEISPDGRRIIGSVTNFMTGITTPIILSR